MNRRTPVQEVLARLSEADRGALLPSLRPSVLREVQLFARDRAIRDAAQLLEHLPRMEGARQLEQILRSYLAGADWQRDRHLVELPAGAPVARRLVHRIAFASAGRPPGWRQLRNVLDGHRG